MKKPPQSLKSTVVRRQPLAPPGNPSLSEQLQTLTPTPTKVKLNPHNLQTAYLKRLCGQTVHVKCLDGERLGGIFKSFD